MPLYTGVNYIVITMSVVSNKRLFKPPIVTKSVVSNNRLLKPPIEIVFFFNLQKSATFS